MVTMQGKGLSPESIKKSSKCKSNKVESDDVTQACNHKNSIPTTLHLNQASVAQNETTKILYLLYNVAKPKVTNNAIIVLLSKKYTDNTSEDSKSITFDRGNAVRAEPIYNRTLLQTKLYIEIHNQVFYAQIIKINKIQSYVSSTPKMSCTSTARGLESCYWKHLDIVTPGSNLYISDTVKALLIDLSFCHGNDENEKASGRITSTQGGHTANWILNKRRHIAR